MNHMIKEQYFIPSNNLPKIAEIRYLDAEQNLLSWEQSEEQRRVEESYYEEFTTSYSNLGVTKGYGPRNGSKMKKNKVKVKEKRNKDRKNNKTEKNGFLSAARGELWDKEVVICRDSDFQVGSITTSVGANAGAGGAIASGGIDCSIFKIKGGGCETRLLSASIGGEIGVGPGGIVAGYSAGVDLVNFKKGGFQFNLGLDEGSGISVGPGGVEAKVGGFGLSIGKRTGISSLIGRISFDFEEDELEKNKIKPTNWWGLGTFLYLVLTFSSTFGYLKYGEGRGILGAFGRMNVPERFVVVPAISLLNILVVILIYLIFRPQELAAKINNFSLTFTLNKDEKSEPFGSVSSKEILNQLLEAGFDFQKNQLLNFQPLHKLGENYIAKKLTSIFPEKTKKFKSKIILGDVIKVLKKLDRNNKFEVIIADPPYNIGKDFGNNIDYVELKKYIN
ncbi:21703_t:CDS:2 [Gigaspora margarita]|uniref:21703_t:CDS:1 n=1 Tax=Gigaspora margarita TaxID=4874 RepID=A0ABM8VVA2_GIGMA|nr:21703_t:CDS:2 [Gigaspora margarita]